MSIQEHEFTLVIQTRVHDDTMSQTIIDARHRQTAFGLISQIHQLVSEYGHDHNIVDAAIFTEFLNIPEGKENR